MTQATVGFHDANGNFVPVTALRPLPTSGGGGAGAVESVNGQTGVVVLTFSDIVPEGSFIEGQIIVVDDAEAPTSAAVLSPLEVSVTDTNTGDSSSISPSGVSVNGVPASLEGHTHAAADVTSGTFSTARIPNLAVSKITGLQAALDGKADAGVIPTPPATGTFVLTATDGVLSWEAQA